MKCDLDRFVLDINSKVVKSDLLHSQKFIQTFGKKTDFFQRMHDIMNHEKHILHTFLGKESRGIP